MIPGFNWLTAIRLMFLAVAGFALWQSLETAKDMGRTEVALAWSAERAQQAEAALKAQLAEQERQRIERERIEKERKDHAQALARADAVAAGARSELDRLRSAIKALAPRGAGVPQAPAPAPGAADPGAFPELFAECAGAHQELAAEADRLALRLKALLELAPR